MSKPKIILISIGGVIVLATIALAIMIWTAFTGRSEKAGELDFVREKVGRLVRLPIYPSIAGVRTLESNRTDFAVWTEDAHALAARGDKSFESTTPPAFKTFLVEEARRLSELPGAVEGKLVKPGFAFGFSEYISGGVMPKEADLPRLQREWYDVTTVIEALAATGVTEIVDVTMAVQPKESDGEKGNKARKNKNKSKAKAKEKLGTPIFVTPNVSRFVVTLKAHPQGIVNAINALAASSRFIVVDDIHFLHETDGLAAALDGDEKKESTSSRRSSRRRRGASAEKENAGFGSANGDGATAQTNAVRIVSDPLKPEPFKVTIKFSVYDFRTKETAALETATAKTPEKKEVQK